jgi:hypothetical protein
MIFDFTTTACARPDLLERTYNSFFNNLIDVDFHRCTLYINIDPIPDKGQVQKCISVSEKFFGKVIYNTPDKANFTRALKWCWSQNGDSKYIFNLEDDWICLRPIRINEYITLLEQKEDRVAVNLRAYIKPKKRICLSPSIWKRFYVKSITAKLNDNYNPEKQLRRSYDSKNFIGIDIGFYESLHYPNKIIIKDIGREWAKNNLLEKDKSHNKSKNFITWRKY